MHNYLVIIVVCAGIAISWGTTAFYAYHVREEAELRFKWAATERFLAVKNGVEEATKSLEDITSFYTSSKFVDRMQLFRMKN